MIVIRTRCKQRTVDDPTSMTRQSAAVPDLYSGRLQSEYSPAPVALKIIYLILRPGLFSAPNLAARRGQALRPLTDEC